MTFHYRDTPNELRPELIEKARALIEGFGFNAAESQCALEAKPPVQWNKGECKRAPASGRFFFFLNESNILLSGRASIYILRTAFGVDWSERIKIIYAGDDATDEDAMLVRVSKTILVHRALYLFYFCINYNYFSEFRL